MKKIFSQEGHCKSMQCFQSVWNVLSMVLLVVVLWNIFLNKGFRMGHNAGYQVGVSAGINAGKVQTYQNIAAEVMSKKCSEPSTIFVDKKSFLVLDNDCLAQNTAPEAKGETAEATSEKK